MAEAPKTAPAGASAILLANLFYPERHPTIGFPVNVESLAGDLRGEYGDAVDVAVLDMQRPEMTVDRIVETARARRFDIVGLSVKTGQREIAEQILDGLLALPAERRPRHVMVGGYRPRVFHEEFAEKYPAVLVCIGEGEPTLRGMVQHLRGQARLEDVPNLIYLRDGALQRTERRQHDLSTWHAPGTSSLPFVLANGGVVYLETSRGCSWGKCTFCSRKFSSGTQPAAIPVTRVVAAWREFNRLGVRHVYCADEDFMMNSRARGRAFGQALLEAGVDVEFWVQTTVDGVLKLGRASASSDPDGAQEPLDGRETVAMLKKAGLRRIFFGLESGSETQLVRYRKGVTAREGIRAVELCRELGLEVEVGMIPFDPLASMDELRETVAYVRAHELAPATVKVLNLMCIQNGVAMFAKTKQAGLLTGERDVETFLYPYRFADPRVGDIAARVQAWHRHGLSEFTYALRRLVDADPVNPVSTGFVRELRELEFELLAGLVGADPSADVAIYERLMGRRFEIMQGCMDAVADGRMVDPLGFLTGAFAESFADGEAWTRPSDTADVVRL